MTDDSNVHSPYDLALTLTPLPETCGKAVRLPDPRLDGTTCVRDAGHTGPHRNWCHPECGTCGQELKRGAGVSYVCKHPGFGDLGAVRRANAPHAVQREIAYELANFPTSGRAPDLAQYDLARRITVRLEQAEALSDDLWLVRTAAAERSTAGGAA